MKKGIDKHYVSRAYYACNMTEKSKSNRKRAVNLTLAPDAIRKGNSLKKKLCRPSLSNVVEFLVEEKYEQVLAAAN